MRTFLNKLMGTNSQTNVGYATVMVVYQLDKNTWRGFVMPFDITFEGETREQVVTILKNMIGSYIDGLKKALEQGREMLAMVNDK